MRMRKKKWAEPYLAAHPEYAYQNPTEYKGQWKQLLGCRLLHVELGPGKGDYLNAMAALYPEDGWVGIEREHNVAAVACRKAIELPELHRQRLIVGDAVNLEDWFAPGEINCIHLNFSDPWPKKYTHKRRLSSSSFLAIYRRLLAAQGWIEMKTDNKDLFEDSVLYFLAGDFSLTQFSVDYRRKEHPEDAITEYEARFLALGQPIYRLVAMPQKTSRPAANMLK